MRIAHLILTHKNPGQLERLLNALEHPCFTFYVHVDKKADQQAFSYLSARKNVRFVRKRTRIYWAGYGTIQATINGFLDILPENYDYINVISGQDFPIKPAAYIYDYLCRSKGKEFMMHDAIDDPGWNVGPRFRNYHLINWRIPGKHRLEKLVNKLLPARKFPLEGHAIVGRANWFTVTGRAAAYMMDFLDHHPEVIRYYKYCWGADEFIWSSMLYNSSFRDSLVDNLIYVDWPAAHAGHPKMLDAGDFNTLIASDKLFARKMDMDKDSRIFTLLEEWLSSPDNPYQNVPDASQTLN